MWWETAAAAASGCLIKLTATELPAARQAATPQLSAAQAREAAPCTAPSEPQTRNKPQETKDVVCRELRYDFFFSLSSSSRVWVVVFVVVPRVPVAPEAMQRRRSSDVASAVGHVRVCMRYAAAVRPWAWGTGSGVVRDAFGQPAWTRGLPRAGCCHAPCCALVHARLALGSSECPWQSAGRGACALFQSRCRDPCFTASPKPRFSWLRACFSPSHSLPPPIPRFCSFGCAPGEPPGL